MSEYICNIGPDFHLDRGSRVRVKQNARTFPGRSGDEGYVRNTDGREKVLVQFEDKEEWVGLREDLLLVAFYTGAAPNPHHDKE